MIFPEFCEVGLPIHNSPPTSVIRPPPLPTKPLTVYREIRHKQVLRQCPLIKHITTTNRGIYTGFPHRQNHRQHWRVKQARSTSTQALLLFFSLMIRMTLIL